MIKNKDSITYDIKAKIKSGKYIFVSDMIISYDEALKIAKNVVKKNKESIDCVEIWETKNKITTNFKSKLP